MNSTRPDKQGLPLSPVQQGMYFHHLHRKNRVYCEQMMCEVIGHLELPLAERSLNQLAEAHDCLRTVFVNDGHEGPRQLVRTHRPLPLRYRDISMLPDPDVFFARHVAEDMEKNFDLAVETSRCELLKIGPDRHVFLWTYHHLIMDSWTIRLLQEQFCATYHAVWNRADPPTLTRVPYRLYLEWIERQDERAAGTYWRNYLDKYSRPAEPMLPATDIDEHMVTVVVEGGASARELLGMLARRHRCTVNHVMLAAWGAHVLEHFQRAEAIFGCVVSGRMIRLHDVGKIGGLFVNAIPVRVSATATVAETIAQVRQHMIKSSEFAYMSLSDIMAYGNTTPASVLTVVNFSINQVALDDRHGPELPFQVRNIRYNEQAHYDAYLDVYITERDLKIAIHHDPRRVSFDQTVVGITLARVLKQFFASAEASLGDVLFRLMDSDLPASGVLHFGDPP